MKTLEFQHIFEALLANNHFFLHNKELLALHSTAEIHMNKLRYQRELFLIKICLECVSLLRKFLRASNGNANEINDDECDIVKDLNNQALRSRSKSGLP